MSKINKLEKYEIGGVRDFSLTQIFECGQCFRWNAEENGSYSGIVNEHFANVSYDLKAETLTIWSNLIPGSDALRERFWRNYFDLDRDYSEIKAFLSEGDPIMAAAISAGSGIRILNQEPWEVLISFIISQNNNIPRIRGCVESLCKNFGEKLGKFYGRDLFAFPKVSTLAALYESDLDVCRLGYRARYIAETARQIEYDGGALLASGQYMSSDRLEEYLLSLSGVGPKVANCIMLFAMKKAEIFPIDVWVKRVMNRLYEIDEKDLAAMKEYSRVHFGKYGGIAQQYLFNYIRAEGIELPAEPAIELPDEI
ncbi:MAG: 8-oxoguanine DNA glycosylase [Clostridiales Family XIII bacterium]|jgi:N-glycosylase/DNA lyase|nr:8-oxoguanine DNA glycosylase [Clostridiales Family XIII bacterium]